MIYFTQASPVLRVYAILLLFAAIILELFLLILTAHRTGRRYQFTANCMLFAAASILMCGLTAAHGHHGPSEILFTEVPYLFVLTAGIVFTIHASAAIAMEIRRRRTALSPYSIKEAFDNLPDGVCFFTGNGIPVLCNRTMPRLAYAVTGRDIQHISELKTALEALPEQADAVRDGAVYCL